MAKKPGTPGRTRISRKTTRAGNAGCFGVPVVTCLRAFFTCTQGCGCVRCTGIPCALFFVRDKIEQHSGAKRVAGMLMLVFSVVMPRFKRASNIPEAAVLTHVCRHWNTGSPDPGYAKASPALQRSGRRSFSEGGKSGDDTDV